MEGVIICKEYFKNKATELGAEDAVIFSIDDIEFDYRTLLKCMYGCVQWGKGHTCPSSENSLKPWEYELILKKYKWGIIIHSHNKKIAQDVSYEIEKEAFLKGYYFAISFSNCAICNKCCGFKGESCANPIKARPEFHSVGIDVYKTVNKFNLPIQVLKSKDEQPNWYSAVFIE